MGRLVVRQPTKCGNILGRIKIRCDVNFVTKDLTDSLPPPPPKRYCFRLYLTLKGKLRPALRNEDLIPFIPLLVMYTYSGTTFVNTFVMWCWIVIIASFFFALNGVNASHHHPEIFHDGDAPR
jgi:hypothetical protein